MRSPITVAAHERPLGSVSGPGLLRIASGIATLPASCSSARVADPLDLLGGQPEPARGALGEPATP